MKTPPKLLEAKKSENFDSKMSTVLEMLLFPNLSPVTKKVKTMTATGPDFDPIQLDIPPQLSPATALDSTKATAAKSWKLSAMIPEYSPTLSPATKTPLNKEAQLSLAVKVEPALQ